MRRIAVLVPVVLAAALALTACGGGGGAAKTPAPTTGGGAAAVPVVATETPDLSKVESAYPAAFPEVDDATPPEVAENLKLKRPMLIVFYDNSQKTTNDQKTEVDAIMKKYRGLIELVSFDVSKAIEGLKSKEASAALQAALFGEQLKIGFTPYILFVDKTATITYRSSGLLDRGMLEREVLRATQ